MGQTTIIATPDGDFSGYLATPSVADAPGLIVIQEIFGVNAVMRDITDEFARAGFIALCPDLFWRIEPNIDISDKSQAEWDKAFALFGQFDVDKGVGDIAAAIGYLRAHGGCSGRVNAVGFCLGGRLAYLTAARTDIDASVGYYGVGIEGLLDEAVDIKNPLMLHIAGKDEFVPPEAQRAIHGALESHRQVTLYDYPEDDHAFARKGGAHYNAQSAEIANARVLAFFNQ